MPRSAAAGPTELAARLDSVARDLTALAECTLYLLRHAKSSWTDSNLPDFDRPLSSRGMHDGKHFAPHLIQELEVPDLALCSTAQRARATLEFLVPVLVPQDRVRFEDALYHASSTQLLSRIREVPRWTRCMMIVAHNPGLTDLVNLLVDSPAGAIENLPTFGLARFTMRCDFADLDAGEARLSALLRPRDAED